MSVPIGPTSLDLPAWVQAIGSVAAIFVAIAVSRSETRRAERYRREDLAYQKKETLARRVQFLGFVVDKLNETMESLEHLGERQSNLTIGYPETSPPQGSWKDFGPSQINSFSSIVNRLEDFRTSIPLGMWPDVEVYDAFTSGTKRLLFISDDFSEYSLPKELQTESDYFHFWTEHLMMLPFYTDTLAEIFDLFIHIWARDQSEASRHGIETRFQNVREAKTAIQNDLSQKILLRETGDNKKSWEFYINNIRTLREIFRRSLK